jgi:hypothetical protein
VLEGLGFPKAKDNQEVRSDRYWDLMRSRSDGLVTLLRDMPYHVLMLCLLDDRIVGKDDEATRVVGPDTPMRALATKLIASTNACGLSYADQRATLDDKGEPVYHHEYKVRFRGPRYMALKSTEPLLDVEIPDVTGWISRVFAHDADLGQHERDTRAHVVDAPVTSNEASSKDEVVDSVPTPIAPPASLKTSGPRRRSAAAASQGGV